MFQDNNVKMFLGSNVEMFQNRNVDLFPANNADLFQNSPVEVFPNSNVPMFPANNVSLCPSKNATKFVKIYSGVKFVTEIKSLSVFYFPLYVPSISSLHFTKIKLVSAKMFTLED